VKKIDIFLTSFLDGDEPNIDTEAMLLGIFNTHEATNCGNMKCSRWRTHVYDPVLKMRVKIGEEGRERESSLRFYLRCVYERAVNEQNRDQSILVDYCEFILAEFGNVLILSSVFKELSKKYLSIFDRVRLYKMRLCLKEQTDQFNRQIFEGKLELEEMMEAEEHYENIEVNVREVTRRNLEVWREMRK